MVLPGGARRECTLLSGGALGRAVLHCRLPAALWHLLLLPAPPPAPPQPVRPQLSFAKKLDLERGEVASRFPKSEFVLLPSWRC